MPTETGNCAQVHRAKAKATRAALPRGEDSERQPREKNATRQRRIRGEPVVRARGRFQRRNRRKDWLHDRDLSGSQLVDGPLGLVDRSDGCLGRLTVLTMAHRSAMDDVLGLGRSRGFGPVAARRLVPVPMLRTASPGGILGRPIMPAATSAGRMLFALHPARARQTRQRRQQEHDRRQPRGESGHADFCKNAGHPSARIGAPLKKPTPLYLSPPNPRTPISVPDVCTF